MQKALLATGIGAIVVGIGAFYAFRIAAPQTAMSLSLTSEFQNGASIPARFTCDADNVNPKISIGGVPEGTASLALIMDDPDVPKVLRPDGMFDHWVLFNIPPTTTEIVEGGSAGIAGHNGRGEPAYTGPCPPREYEPREHRYFFRLYALDIELELTEGASKEDVLKAMEGHVLEEAELMGRYQRP